MHRNYGISRVGLHVALVTPAQHRRPPSAFRRAAVILGKAATVTALALGAGVLFANWVSL